MKSIRAHDFGPPEVMQPEEIPDLVPGLGQMVVAVKAAGVNPVDTYIRSGPFAQKRFAEKAKLSNITFLSDYRDGSFCRATGLLLDDMLQARSVFVVGRKGIVRYIQAVPELSHLPDLGAAFSKAESFL